MSDIHPLALAYLRAFAEAHHARGNVVPTGMPSPRAAMRRARDAWQRAGCPVEAASEPVSRPVTGGSARLSSCASLSAACSWSTPGACGWWTPKPPPPRGSGRLGGGL